MLPLVIFVKNTTGIPALKRLIGSGRVTSFNDTRKNTRFFNISILYKPRSTG